ncbi:MAG: phosphoribosylformylglycinamidine synthase [Bacteroidota bacterium]
MILFFGNSDTKVFAVQVDQQPAEEDILKLSWLFGNQPKIESTEITGTFIGPRAAMVTPWSTNAVEITQNMSIEGIQRIEQFSQEGLLEGAFDPMLSQKFQKLHQDLFQVNIEPEDIQAIDDIAAYNASEGLALSQEEIQYLEGVATKIGRKLTDSEVFGFSQVNSEHCRHKIFNGTFILNGKEQESSLFNLIRKTSKENPNEIVSAYKDNVAFINGPNAVQFAPDRADKPGIYKETAFKSVLSLKAETHNFPTTVEPFNGAATGSGGEIRDRLAGGKGAVPLAGTAVYMTSYSRLKANRPWEKAMPERPWLYQTPMDILIKASNGASDFGNKFGQPLISGSLLTFEHQEEGRKLGFDKVIMLAGGIGYGKKEQAMKDVPKKGDLIVVMGGDNYRIGMGGAAVSSADTGEFGAGIELNAVQRSNPEMQKRVANAIRSFVESEKNPIVSIHDHGAGGHLNCLSELVEEVGGTINLDKLPVGDPTLSAKEIIGNESQERMGLIISPDQLDRLQRIAARERAPFYVVGEVSGDKRFSFVSASTQAKPMDLALEDMFGSSPKTRMVDNGAQKAYKAFPYDTSKIQDYIKDVLRLESVACKDWLTNKVDRCVGGLVAKQQCAGPLQLPLNNCGVMAIDFQGMAGIATSIGHAPISSLIDPAIGARQSIAEALTNLVWAPLTHGLSAVSLSANWMWPCRNEGEDSRLYKAVKAVSDYAIELGINVPTGKDSLSMKQKYPDDEVIAPGTVIISAVGACDNISKVVEPVLQADGGDIYYIGLSNPQNNKLFQLGGSAFAQTQNAIGAMAPDVKQGADFTKIFNDIQGLIRAGNVVAGHDVSSGGLITCLLEMCFATNHLGADIQFDDLELDNDLIEILFSENCGLVIQVRKGFDPIQEGHTFFQKLGSVNHSGTLNVRYKTQEEVFDVHMLRDVWYETSYLLDQKQTAKDLASKRFENYKSQPLNFVFPSAALGPSSVYSPLRPEIISSAYTYSAKRIRAAVIREKGSNSEREMAHALFLAGFEVRDVHMTDLIAGRETLEDVQFIGAVGGFSNSDVLGSAKGWAGAFKYNDKARKSLESFFKREDTLSIGICNGCQLFLELDLIYPEHDQQALMGFNDSLKHESAFTSVQIQKSNAVMLSSLVGTTLGVWISHGEGKFCLPLEATQYNIAATYGYAAYPANPNGSDYNTAMLCSQDGRHLVTMPHIERSIFPWNWAHYPKDRPQDQVSPWLQAFKDAYQWLKDKGYE